MSVVSCPPSGKLSVAGLLGILILFCAATVIVSPAQTLTTLTSFNGTNGADVQSGLVRNSDGNFYGTTFSGGTNDEGTVYKITPGGTLTTLHNFQGPFADGGFPLASLVQGTDGNFYGTTTIGGDGGIGTVFKITPGGTLGLVHSFNGIDGAAPESELVQANDGNFYGTTSQVGLNGLGTVFKITPGGTLTTLTNFVQGGSSGSSPYGGLVQGADGNLYGTTFAGGTSQNCQGGCGTVFKITLSGTLTVLHSFSGGDGANPQARLLKATDGNFYGTTLNGGTHGLGTAFKITSGGAFTSLHSFGGTSEGNTLSAGLIQATDGFFYGTTANGGLHDDGTIFKITSTGVLTTLYSFQGLVDGAHPADPLLQAPNGLFYGTTEEAGSNGFGTVFSLTVPTTSTTTVTSTPNPSMSGALVTITATVGPAGPPVPTGNVEFTSNGTTIPGCSSVMLGSSRTAVCATSGLAVGTDAIVATYSGDSNYGPSSGMVVQIVNPLASPLQFVSVSPCRIVDTRNPNGPFGGPPIPGQSSRSFPLTEGDNPCGIPSSAVAYSLNVTVVPLTTLNFLTIWPTGEGQPTVSTLNSPDGRTKANAAIVPAGSPSGGVSVYVTQTTNVIIDVNGYFKPADGSTLQFYSVAPCRVADTRNANGPLGGPPLMGTVERDFPVLSSACNLPNTAVAYSLNFTALPLAGHLGFLTVWPQGQPRPTVSTLNDPTGTTVANAAIVPAGTSGGVATYASQDTNLIIDVNGYFAAPGAGGLSLNVLTPCRVLDTRNGNGAFMGELTVHVTTSFCQVTGSAKAYVFNATVLPVHNLGFLTLWPDGSPQPTVSTLNAPDGAITSNMAIVPTNNGSIDAYASQATQLILDISSYFAP
jgi:uncharacterized repeat protein (TIGR03803 family)